MKDFEFDGLFNEDKFIEYGDKISDGPLERFTYDDEIEMMCHEKLLRAQRLSCDTYCGPKEIKRKEKNKATLIKGSAILLCIALATGVVVKTHNTMEQQNAKNKAAYEMSYMVNDNTHHTGYNDEYYYSHEEIAKDILNYNGNRDMDSVIYACYANINYDVITQMNKIFQIMKTYIDLEPEKYSDDVIRACYYSSFDDYMTAHNFKDIKDYKNTMEKIMVAYQGNNVSSEEYHKLLNALYEGENYGRK